MKVCRPADTSTALRPDSSIVRPLRVLQNEGKASGKYHADVDDRAIWILDDAARHALHAAIHPREGAGEASCVIANDRVW